MVLKAEKSNYVCLHSVSDFCHRSAPTSASAATAAAAADAAAEAAAAAASSIVFAAWHTLGEAFEMLVQHALDIFASA